MNSTVNELLRREAALECGAMIRDLKNYHTPIFFEYKIS